MRKIILLAAALAALVAAGPVLASSDMPKPPAQKWEFDGFFGRFDHAALRRGFQVYKDVCASCHSLRLVAYRNLLAIGFTEEQVKEVAAAYQVKDGPNDQGEMFDRPAKLSDRFVPPFPNAQAARVANNGALPPDLSLMVKARKGGADYLYAILTGYKDAPEGFQLNDGMMYNEYFMGHQIAMPQPLSDGQVEYADGTKNDLPQLARDVTAFLAWAAEPELEDRKSMGLKSLIFLVVLTALLYALKRQVWKDVH
jgi:cytochrome c1